MLLTEIFITYRIHIAAITRQDLLLVTLFQRLQSTFFSFAYAESHIRWCKIPIQHFKMKM